MLCLAKDKSKSGWINAGEPLGLGESITSLSSPLNTIRHHHPTQTKTWIKPTVPRRQPPLKRPKRHQVVGHKQEDGDWSTLPPIENPTKRLGSVGLLAKYGKALSRGPRPCGEGGSAIKVWQGFNGHVYFEPLRCKALLNSERKGPPSSTKEKRTTKLPLVKSSFDSKYTLDLPYSRIKHNSTGSLVVMGDGRNNDLKRTGNFVQSNNFRTKVFRGVVSKSSGVRSRSPPWTELSKGAIVEGSKTSPVDKIVTRKAGDCACRHQQRNLKLNASTMVHAKAVYEEITKSGFHAVVSSGIKKQTTSPLDTNDGETDHYFVNDVDVDVSEL